MIPYRLLLLPSAALCFMLALLPLVTAGSPQAEWRYCLAVSPELSEVILSDPLLTDRPLPVLETEFDRWLDEQGMRHEAAACPRAETPRRVEELRAFAVRYNSRIGLSPRFVAWSPP